VEPPLIFEEAMELEHPLVLLEPLAFLLARMLDQLCARLAARALAAQELRLQMELDSGFQFREDLHCHPEQSDCHPERSEGPMHFAGSIRMPGTASPTRSKPETRNSKLFTRTLQLPLPMLDAKIFLKLLQLDLKAHPPGAPILKVHLSATPAQPRTMQAGLFLPPIPEPEKLEFTLARIAGMVGEDKVGSMQLLDSHRPEAFRMQRFVPSEPQGQKANNVSCNAPVTALRVFRPPLRATVTLRDGQPAHLACPKRKEVQGDILWMAGPWRSSGDWWEQDGWARAEWDIAIQPPVPSRQFLRSMQGRLQSIPGNPAPAKSMMALYRLVHDLLSGHWFVEGIYD
jgi:protein ImuB